MDNTPEKTVVRDVRRDNSRRFISQYLLDCRLREVSGFDENEDCKTRGDIVIPRRRQFDADLQEGQIRLLSQPAELTYAVLLRRWGDNAFVVAPFSRFSSPATDEELKTVFDGGLYLRVLQIWNIRTALDATLKKSWLIGTLPPQDIEDAWKAWEWTLGGAELPASILERTGVAIYRMGDPRRDYLRAETEKFAPFDAEDEAHAEEAEENDAANWPSVQDIWQRAGIVFRRRIVDEESMRAAAASVSLNSRRTFLVKGRPVKLRGEYSQTGKALLFSVWDRKRRVKSDVLDGFRILVEGAAEAVPIRGETAHLPVPKPSAEFVLLDLDGEIVEMLEEDESSGFDDGTVHIDGFGKGAPKPGDVPFDALSFQDDLVPSHAGLDALLYPTASLLAVLVDSSASPESKALAAAELLVRHVFLEGADGEIEKALEGFLGASALSRFDQSVRNFEDNADDVRPDDVLRTLRGLPCERVVCDRLRPVLEADGFIPLALHGVEGRPACLLPFAFEPDSRGGEGGAVLDWQGSVNKEWTLLFRDRLPGRFVRHGKPYCIRLAFVAEDRLCESLPIGGESLLLPVLMAWERFCGRLPRYNVFRLFATGEILPNGELRRVETKAKWSLIHTMPAARLLAPDTGDPESQDSSGAIPEGASVQGGLPPAVVEKVEEWFVSDWRYAVARLADQGLVSEINHGRYGGWDRMIDRLEHLGAPLAGVDVRERLLTEMWLGQACCHAGRTDAAMEHNRRAHQLASQAPEFRYELQRLDVEMIVNLTDKESFDEVRALSESLEKELREENWKDKSQQADLSMRWHGSLGQALAYGALDGRPGFSREDAKAALEAALADARRRKALLVAQDPEADVSGADADIVQDANYLHLWHVLFDPSSKPASDSYAEARQLRRRLEGRSASRRTNEVYQLRQLALAAYRRLLSGEPADAIVAETTEREPMAAFLGLVDDSEAAPWLRATVAKYLGALLAASGDAKGARDLFATACSMLPVESVKSIPGEDGKIFRKLAMTVRAEAFRSLRAFFPEEAARCLNEAKALLEGVPDSEGRWRAWIDHTDSAPFPGLSYWY